MRIVDWYALSSKHVQPGKENGSRVLVMCPDGRMSAELAGALASELPAARLVSVRAYPDRAEATKLASQAQVCFLDVASDTACAVSLASWLAADVPDLPVIVLLPANDPDLILKCLRCGAAEFLILPFTQDQLHAVLEKLARLRSGLGNRKEGSGKVYCVLPGKGASGATTVACDLAFALKRLHSGKVLLADLDGLTGTIAFVLKLKSNYSFVDAVGQAAGLEQEAWKALVASCHGVDVLLSPDNPVDCYSEPLDPTSLLASARQVYDLVVLDGGGVYGDWNEALARLADALLIVTTNELPALHATQRALAHLEKAGVSRSKARMIVNRYHPKTGLLADAIESALGSTVFATLPSDYEAIQKALMQGQPSAPASAFGRGITALARTLMGAQVAVQKTTALGWLRSLFV
jgi:pilus assembly protein CpaE